MILVSLEAYCWVATLSQTHNGGGVDVSSKQGEGDGSRTTPTPHSTLALCKELFLKDDL